MKFFDRDLKVHAWGGLGSQLFAVALATRLQNHYPKKRIKIVLHSGGVTKRMPEVVSLYPEICFEFVDDYTAQFSHSKLSKNRSFIKILIKDFVLRTGFLSEANGDSEILKIKPWCRTLRGHYSYATVDRLFILDLYKRLLSLVDQDCLENRLVAIHYRLGDLLSLEDKSYIAPSRIVRAVSDLGVPEGSQEISLYSDSPSVAREKLQSLDSVARLQIHSTSAIETILECSRSRYFIGTSSKISFWIAGIRNHCFSTCSKLPIENFREYRGLIQGYSKDEIAYL
jgi:hypothetical protein